MPTYKAVSVPDTHGMPGTMMVCRDLCDRSMRQ